MSDVGKAARISMLGINERINSIEKRHDEEILALQNEVKLLGELVQGQSRTIGVAMQGIMGSGSTVPDPHPEDTR